MISKIYQNLTYILAGEFTDEILSLHPGAWIAPQNFDPLKNPAN